MNHPHTDMIGEATFESVGRTLQAIQVAGIRWSDYLKGTAEGSPVDSEEDFSSFGRLLQHSSALATLLGKAGGAACREGEARLDLPATLLKDVAQSLNALIVAAVLLTDKGDAETKVETGTMVSDTLVAKAVDYQAAVLAYHDTLSERRATSPEGN